MYVYVWLNDMSLFMWTRAHEIRWEEKDVWKIEAKNDSLEQYGERGSANSGALIHVQSSVTELHVREV